MTPVDGSPGGASERVCIADERLVQSLAGLLPVLAGLLPITWAGRDAASDSPALATVDVAPHGQATPAFQRTPLLLVPSPDAARPTQIVDAVSFADAAEVPQPFRGRSLDIRVEVDPDVHRALPGRAGRVLLRTPSGAPIWTVDGPASRPLHRTSLRLPRLEGGDVGLAAGGAAFLQLLPLFHLLRSALGARAPVDPPLRAGFIIDDPNLHWPTYGHADYRAIAASAARERYHVAFATVPFDAWWVHAPTAAIFRAHPRQLSLLVHGNDHARRELMRDKSPAACTATLRQAVHRIDELERKAGLHVERVMVPPHGACSAQMLAALPRNGFEAACISAGSLRACNAERRWSRSLGFAPAEDAEGCTVLPRWPMEGTDLATILVAAYLGQPLILRGHHPDLKRGHDALRAWAHAINALGHVRWGTPARLARLSYRRRIAGTTLWIEPCARRLEVRVPDGVGEVRIAQGRGVWQALDGSGARPPDPRDDTGDFVHGAVPGQTLDLINRTGVADSARLTDPPSRTALPVRRLLTEVRDRLRLNGALRSGPLGM